MKKEQANKLLNDFAQLMNNNQILLGALNEIAKLLDSLYSENEKLEKIPELEKEISKLRKELSEIQTIEGDTD